MAQISRLEDRVGGRERPLGVEPETLERPTGVAEGPPARPIGVTVDPRERPMGELVKELSEEASALVRQEVQLAKIELAEKGKAAAAGGGLLSGSLLFAFLSLSVFSAAAVLALTEVFVPWLAGVIVGAAYLVLAGILFAAGRHELRKAGSPVPEETVETIREDAEWIRRRSRSAAR